MLYNCCVRIKFWIDFLYVFAVEAYTASWIEILRLFCCCLWGICRGLYSLVDWNGAVAMYHGTRPGRGLYSLVDWNIDFERDIPGNAGRGLYSLVDWNTADGKPGYKKAVEAYTASWIEISSWYYTVNNTASRLIQPRGLKWVTSDGHSVKVWSRLIQPRGLKYGYDSSEYFTHLSRLIQPRGLK